MVWKKKLLMYNACWILPNKNIPRSIHAKVLTLIQVFNINTESNLLVSKYLPLCRVDIQVADLGLE